MRQVKLIPGPSPYQLAPDTPNTLAEIRLINIVLHKLTPIYFRSGFTNMDLFSLRKTGEFLIIV